MSPDEQNDTQVIQDSDDSILPLTDELNDKKNKPHTHQINDLVILKKHILNPEKYRLRRVNKKNNR